MNGLAGEWLRIIPAEQDFTDKVRNTAYYLRDNFKDLTAWEASVIADRLEQCAQRIKELELLLAKR